MKLSRASVLVASFTLLHACSTLPVREVQGLNTPSSEQFTGPLELKPDRTRDPALPRPGYPDYQQAQETVRFLMQASFGPTAQSVAELLASGNNFDAWIDTQMRLPRHAHLSLLDQRLAQIGLEPAPLKEDDTEGWLRDIQRSDIWWENAIWGQDQLRQRVVYALSQLLVISNVSDDLYNDSRGIANYHDLLSEHAFGNYRELLLAVTLNPMMGEYLSMIRNEKADMKRNIRPDENYAREIMQLFSLGLYELNSDGSVKYRKGEKISTYNQQDIKALARVFTGWYHGNIDHTWEYVTGADSEVVAMKAFDFKHDYNKKILLGKPIPAGQSPLEDIHTAIDIIFSHHNLAPFVSQHLIQRLVTSNPSPRYVKRVAKVFNNNGKGVKGDLAAVIKAILLDKEARDAPGPQFGKIKEPILKVSAIWRAYKAQGAPIRENNGSLSQNRLRYRGTDRHYGQRPYGSASVFNFYQADYQFPGATKQKGLVFPELQIHTDSHFMKAANTLGDTIYWRDENGNWAQTEEARASWDLYPSQLYLENEKALAADDGALLDKANLLLMAGAMSDITYQAILELLNNYADSPSYEATLGIYDMLYLIAASPEFALQR